MAQACPNCRWYSPDEVEVCSHCGEPLPEPEPLSKEGLETPLQVAWNWIQFFLGLGLLGLFGFVVLNRYGAQLRGGLDMLHVGWRNLWSWLVGPEGQYADYIGIAILVSALFWVVLWLFNKLNR